MSEKIKKISKKRVVFLDGAMGTQLQRLGMPQGACPELWCLKNPRILQDIHRAYQKSGSDIIYTCTFGANAVKLQQYGANDVERINAQLARIARKAVGPHMLIAGDIGPTGEFIEPFGPMSFEKAVEVFKQQIKGLLAGGVDLLVIETMMDIQEARAALIAARELTKKFVMVTMTIEPSGRTLNGTDPITALITLQSLGANAVGCNCSAGPKEMVKFIRAMKPYATVPLVAKPNAGLPQLHNGTTVFQMKPAQFARNAKALVRGGACLIGGCCGTTPEHISALKASVKGLQPFKTARVALSAVSSARDHVIFEDRKKCVVIGESINPTRRKALQQEFREAKTALACQLAKEQEHEGAVMLDVNVGAAGVDEEQLMPLVVGALSISSSLPLVLDTSCLRAMEKALRVYPGRALINSICAERSKMIPLLKLAAKYGAMFIALPVGLKGVPKNLSDRKHAIQYLVSNAKRCGIAKENIIVDGLVMAVSSLPGSAQDTLKTVRWCRNVLRCHTVVGLSNVSFGLPQRQVLNGTFYSLLRKNGLSAVIAHPGHLSIKEDAYAKDVLMDRDKDARRFIAHAQNAQELPSLNPAPLDIKEAVRQAILDGNREQIVSLVQKAEAQEIDASCLVHDVMIPAINKVGEFFEAKRYFLPQLVASAEAMKNAFAYLEPKLMRKKAEGLRKTVVILATVQGDIHDIGKNIVALMLKNHGLEVVDLGKDVPASRIVAEIKRHHSPIVGLSALMTTTMVNMREVVDLARAQGLRCRFMVGGAVVTEDYAQSLGATFSRDGVEAVKVVRRLAENAHL
ncbi:MAG TPA: homocysteine S-methyltransferase family protein [Candidatus Omnitrophota bacterium]|nr:homocysteine S-methyltransferase family protein [Candidatus Omnitrophota bacterium]